MHSNYSLKISCGHISTSYNEIAKCVINGFNDSVNGRLEISIMDIRLCEFLHKFKMATLEQIHRYFSIIGLNKNWSSRLEKLNKSYNLINEITLYNEKYGEVVCYVLDIGGMYLLNNYSNEDINPRVDDLTSQRKTYDSMFQIHPHSVVKSLICTEIYLRELSKSNIIGIENRFRIREYLEFNNEEIELGNSVFLNLKIDMMLNLDNEINCAYLIKVIIEDEIDKICIYIERFSKFIQNRAYIDKYCSLDVEEVKLNLVFINYDYMKMVEGELKHRDLNLSNVVITNKNLAIEEGIIIEEIAI
ncbi:hypothetical protein EAI30_06845 [Romboutsia ilealis]|uniref:Protein kinase domain-containing protein n=1 Tax=Romboutsia faecis TaxID=2764597 RepID=A0ABR7JKH0_9FIRM|nr:hypothetical protein [Romboutsia faecis]MBC5995428.1 hypothetical protein [Romboutsia faecis]MRN24329.1 hypothetical protein [Romboutsia ilealis]